MATTISKREKTIDNSQRALVSVNTILRLMFLEGLNKQYSEYVMTFLSELFVEQMANLGKPVLFPRSRLKLIFPNNRSTMLTNLLADELIIKKTQRTGRGNVNKFLILPEFMENMVWVPITRNMPIKKITKATKSLAG